MIRSGDQVKGEIAGSLELASDTLYACRSAQSVYLESCAEITGSLRQSASGLATSHLVHSEDIGELLATDRRFKVFETSLRAFVEWCTVRREARVVASTVHQKMRVCTQKWRPEARRLHQMPPQIFRCLQTIAGVEVCVLNKLWESGLDWEGEHRHAGAVSLLGSLGAQGYCSFQVWD